MDIFFSGCSLNSVIKVLQYFHLCRALTVCSTFDGLGIISKSQAFRKGETADWILSVSSNLIYLELTADIYGDKFKHRIPFVTSAFLHGTLQNLSLWLFVGRWPYRLCKVKSVFSFTVLHLFLWPWSNYFEDTVGAEDENESYVFVTGSYLVDFKLCATVSYKYIVMGMLFE